MTESDWKHQDTEIAIFLVENGEWQYSIFDTWDEAREAINAARRDGKAAVFYDGATLPYPPEFSNESEASKD